MCIYIYIHKQLQPHNNHKLHRGWHSSPLLRSYLTLPYLILSYLIWILSESYLILSYLVLSYLILSYLILSCLILSYLILSYLIYLSKICNDSWYMTPIPTPKHIPNHIRAHTHTHTHVSLHIHVYIYIQINKNMNYIHSIATLETMGRSSRAFTDAATNTMVGIPAGVGQLLKSKH